jgi:Fe-Mn family superoxide dismutase
MEFVQPPLPYDFDALEPTISGEALQIHYEDHQRKYIETLHAFVAVKAMPPTTTLEAVVCSAANQKVPKDPYRIPQQPPFNSLFDMAAQAWNHTFFWKSLDPEGGGEPTGLVMDGIRINYGTFEKFRETLRVRALGLFGSGWAWVGVKGDALWCIAGANAALPLVYGISPILCIDMWEHAYYLDYKSDRSAYFDAVMNNLINWDFANENINSAVY